ncbi:MAG: endo-1,3-alpha-glucanase family glycosylhydrolase, partial [Candidatus Paceibacterota bacterium]
MNLKSLIMAGALMASVSAWAGEHYVFANVMVCNPYNGEVSLESYEHQILLARQYGIDGFVLSCGSWVKEPYYIERSTLIYEAARRIDPEFKLFMQIDTANGLDPLETSLDMMKRFAGHPNQFRYEGKPVLAAYSSINVNWREHLTAGVSAGGKSRWEITVSALKDAGYETCFVPFFWTDNYTLAPSYDGALNTFADAPWINGYNLFGVDHPAWDLIRGNANCMRAASKLGKLYMATASFAYNSANLRDFHGMRDYAAIWEGVIKDNADWMLLETWNDYGEDSSLAPANAFLDMGRVDHDESYLDVTAYYSAWYKSEKPPEIRQEKLFYVYRDRSRWQKTCFDSKSQAWIELADQIHDDVEDNIYSTAFLKEPAELTIQSGKEQKTFQLNAGVSHVEIPFQSGVPHFTLKRQGKILADFSGSQEIIKEPNKENSPCPTMKTFRRLNRNWTGAWCLGEAKRFMAESASLLGDAKIVEVSGKKAVKITQDIACGVEFPFAKNTTLSGPLNIRIRYLNSGASGCRLTLTAGAGKGYPLTSFPVFLPPTRSGWTTVSLLWTPPASEPGLRLEYKNGDKGEAVIDYLEIVSSIPFAASPAESSKDPAMVDLPGGSFLMGSANGAPDEAPIHKVTVSPFSMGKYEVTNAEFERFKPEHRKYRDEYSWRDTDPVIYVSWQQAAQYCNWLSAQAGLPPAYDEKTWMVNLRAGYRLPTEAEWEYAASGRGEGRIYPWGNEAPDKIR